MLNNEKYYSELFSKDMKIDNIMKKKIDLILENIPADVKSIIDIGCGNGKITNVLNKFYNVTGVERNEKAIQYVESNTILTSCDDINVSDKSFDMVFSSELLEHLEENIFQKSIIEMKRIAKNYIFLTFPNNENIEKDFIKCKHCDTVFNRTYHLRRLNEDIISKLFSEYKIVKSFNFGTKKRGYNKTLLKIKHRFIPHDSWIPWFWTKNIERKSMCPNCERIIYFKYKFNLFGLILDILNIFLSSHKPFWTFIILKKTSKC